MKFKQGDKAIYQEEEVEILKVLENSNRYRIKTKYSDKNGYMVDESQIHSNLKEYHESYIRFAKERIEQAKRRFEDTKELFDKKIKESEFALHENDGVKKQ